MCRARKRTLWRGRWILWPGLNGHAAGTFCHSVPPGGFAGCGWLKSGQVPGSEGNRILGCFCPMLWCVQTESIRGKSADRIAPEDPITVTEALTMLQRAAALPDVSGIQADLNALAAVHRPAGSQGEKQAVQYLKKRFTEMGYEVTLQSYEDEQGGKGTNVVAVKAAPSPDANILVRSAHHDSVPTAYDANDNASGVTALLPAAEQKLKFSWDDTKMTALRNTIRQQLGLEVFD